MPDIRRNRCDRAYDVEWRASFPPISGSSLQCAPLHARNDVARAARAFPAAGRRGSRMGDQKRAITPAPVVVDNMKQHHDEHRGSMPRWWDQLSPEFAYSLVADLRPQICCRLQQSSGVPRWRDATIHARRQYPKSWAGATRYFLHAPRVSEAACKAWVLVGFTSANVSTTGTVERSEFLRQRQLASRFDRLSPSNPPLRTHHGRGCARLPA